MYLELAFCFTLQKGHSILLGFYQSLTAVGQSLGQSRVRDKTLSNTPLPVKWQREQAGVHQRPEGSSPWAVCLAGGLTTLSPAPAAACG